MVVPYLSIYTVALGATATQLGLVNSLGMGIAGLLSLLSEWLIDRIGIKKIYLTGITMPAISYLTYGLATNWTIIIIAMMAYWLGFTTSVHSCATVCANSLSNQDRATGMSLCETFAAGFLGWDNLGPQYVFLTVIGLDLFIRIPLLMGMPETLDLRIEKG